MKTSSILYVAAAFMLCSFLVSSCKKDTDSEPGAHPLDDDLPIPYDYANWMANIDDSKYLSAITIPGTHDAAADLHSSLQGWNSYITIAQDFRIINQLEMGVRWLDIRLSDDDGTMTAWHGPYYLHKNFNDLIDQAIEFLNNHPTETVIFMIKQEHSTRGDLAFADGVWFHYLAPAMDIHPNLFWLGNFVPQLGQVRGQIVIIRQFEGVHGGLRMKWNDNTTGSFGLTDDGTYVWVQDHYSLNTVSLDTKIAEIEDCITKAHNEPYPDRCYYINFTSGEKDLVQVSLESIASYINPRINDYLHSKNWNNCGVILVNFAGGSNDGEVSQELVETIVNLNTL